MHRADKHKKAGGLRLAMAGLMLALLPGPAQSAPAPDPVAALRARLPQDEVIYFLLPDRFANGDRTNDRGGRSGDRLVTGFDPTDKGFYHGGDLQGVIDRLDYIQGLGASAIWIAPVMANRPVQGGPGQESAGYHGYWITDFTHVDPHLGSDADFARLVAAAHARGIKVYMDIVVNHTADIIAYRECADACAYRSRADYPYQRRARDGAAINPGFAGDGDQGAANFARLTNPDYAYTTSIPKGQEHAKSPDWLNNPIYYHNRGNSTYAGESSTMGDFVGLDDLMTENPRVVRGMIAIYGGWIDRFGIDGFRIDTAKHVNPGFWRAFIPAMQARARARGIPHFHIFGEIGGGGVNPGRQAAYTRTSAFPATLDFAFHAAMVQALAGDGGTDVFEDLFAGDALYQGGARSALGLPTWVSNHDDGRFAYFVRKGLPQASDAEVLARVTLAHAMMLGLRGVPVIYAGDEQGFAGQGGDQDARQDMFASQVPTYRAENLLGGATGAVDHFDPDHPLYRTIAALARIRKATPALRRGEQIIRARGTGPGLLAVSRLDPQDGHEVLMAFNTSTRALTAHVEVSAASSRFAALRGDCPARADAPGRITITLPALGYALCEAQK